MSENKIFGYARVSSKDQNKERQRKELLDFGINDRDIFVDKLSGKISTVPSTRPCGTICCARAMYL